MEKKKNAVQTWGHLVFDTSLKYCITSQDFKQCGHSFSWSFGRQFSKLVNFSRINDSLYRIWIRRKSIAFRSEPMEWQIHFWAVASKVMMSCRIQGKSVHPPFHPFVCLPQASHHRNLGIWTDGRTDRGMYVQISPVFYILYSIVPFKAAALLITIAIAIAILMGPAREPLTIYCRTWSARCITTMPVLSICIQR